MFPFKLRKLDFFHRLIFFENDFLNILVWIEFCLFHSKYLQFEESAGNHGFKFSCSVRKV